MAARTRHSAGSGGASLPSWRRNQIAATLASFIGFTGFTLVMPFLPLYFQQLGLSDVGKIALWSGASLGVTPAITAVLAPLWGRVADRFGRKLMIERSLVACAVLMTGMAYVSQPWHVFALRAVLGLFAGYGALTIAMAVESAPRERMASAIGTVQTAQRLGPALGPIIGGAVAQLVGLRRAFIVSGTFYAAAAVLVFLLYQERRHRPDAADARQTRSITVRDVLAIENFLVLALVIFGLQFVDRSIGPILPLYLVDLGLAVNRAPLVSGILFSTVAGAGALGNQVCTLLLRRWTPRRTIVVAAALAGTAAVIFAMRPDLWIVGGACVTFGLSIGLATTAAYTAAGAVTPPGAHGVAFGVLASASLSGLALSPVLNGALAVASIRAVFLGDALILAALAALVSRVMIRAPLHAETSPPMEEG